MRQIVFFIAALIMIGTAPAGYAAAPTAIAANPGFASGCYNFNNYVAASGSPVVGGALTVAGNYGFYMAPFGQVCSKGAPLTYARPQYQSWVTFYPGYLAWYTYGYGSDAWYYAGPASVSYYDNGCACSLTKSVDNPTVSVACPWNTALIESSGYVRPDGGSIAPNIINADLGVGSGIYWMSPLTGTKTKLFLCVKTDTAP